MNDPAREAELVARVLSGRIPLTERGVAQESEESFTDKPFVVWHCVCDQMNVFFGDTEKEETCLECSRVFTVFDPERDNVQTE